LERRALWRGQADEARVYANDGGRGGGRRTGFGENEEGLRFLEKAFDDRDILLQGFYGSIKTDKRLDSLRGDPRFEQLVERFMAGKSQ